MSKRTSIHTLCGVFFSSVLALSSQPLFADQHSHDNRAHGDTIIVPIASQAPDKQDMPRPRTGQKGTSVIEQFGEPLGVSQPVGEPPITRWDYADFYVYFEYDHVIRSVLKHQPPSQN